MLKNPKSEFFQLLSLSVISFVLLSYLVHYFSALAPCCCFVFRPTSIPFPPSSEVWVCGSPTPISHRTGPNQPINFWHNPHKRSFQSSAMGKLNWSYLVWVIKICEKVCPALAQMSLVGRKWKLQVQEFHYKTGIFGKDCFMISQALLTDLTK